MPWFDFAIHIVNKLTGRTVPKLICAKYVVTKTKNSNMHNSSSFILLHIHQPFWHIVCVSPCKNSWLIGIMKFGFRMKLAWNNLIGFFAAGSVFRRYFCPFLAEKNSFNRIFLRGLVIFSDKSSKDVVHNTLPDMIASE